MKLAAIQHHKTSNKTLARHTLEKEQMLHLKKLKGMKPTMRIEAPKKYSHMRRNGKKMMQEEQRNRDIERANHNLLGRLQKIMHEEQNPEWSTDHEVRSLNAGRRQQTYKKIASENEAMMQRLLEKAPCYDRKTWADERKTREQYLKNISLYPLLPEHISHATPLNRNQPLRPMHQSLPSAQQQPLTDKAPLPAPLRSAGLLGSKAPNPLVLPDPLPGTFSVKSLHWGEEEAAAMQLQAHVRGRQCRQDYSRQKALPGKLSGTVQ